MPAREDCTHSHTISLGIDAPINIRHQDMPRAGHLLKTVYIVPGNFCIPILDSQPSIDPSITVPCS